MSGIRTDKLNSEFQKSIYEILTKKVKDPRLTEMFSILEVRVDKELQTAKVFVSVFSTDQEKAAKTFEAIKEHAGTIRYELAHMMQMRTVPELHFLWDDTMEYGDKIDRLIQSIHKDENK